MVKLLKWQPSQTCHPRCHRWRPLYTSAPPSKVSSTNWILYFQPLSYTPWTSLRSHPKVERHGPLKSHGPNAFGVDMPLVVCNNRSFSPTQRTRHLISSYSQILEVTTYTNLTSVTSTLHKCPSLKSFKHKLDFVLPAFELQFMDFSMVSSKKWSAMVLLNSHGPNVFGVDMPLVVCNNHSFSPAQRTRHLISSCGPVVKFSKW